MKRTLAFALFLAACSGGKTEVTDDFSGITDEKADSFSSKMKLVATLSSPSGNVVVSYTPQPIYRAIKLRAQAGDWVKITVTGGGTQVKGQPPTDGVDPVTFLVDSKFKVVAKNDDANDRTHDSQIVTQLKKGGTFYVIVREYNYASGSFNVDLATARVSGDLVADANAWFGFFFQGNDYSDLAAPYALALSDMPQAAQDDANGFFKTDVGGASGYALPYDDSVMYFLTGGSDGEAYDARPYDADGNPIADTALGGDAADIHFGAPAPHGSK
jgi:hypothetical protein